MSTSRILSLSSLYCGAFHRLSSVLLWPNNRLEPIGERWLLLWWSMAMTLLYSASETHRAWKDCGEDGIISVGEWEESET